MTYLEWQDRMQDRRENIANEIAGQLRARTVLQGRPSGPDSAPGRRPRSPYRAVAVLIVLMALAALFVHFAP